MRVQVIMLLLGSMYEMLGLCGVCFCRQENKGGQFRAEHKWLKH